MYEKCLREFNSLSLTGIVLIFICNYIGNFYFPDAVLQGAIKIVPVLMLICAMHIKNVALIHKYKVKTLLHLISSITLFTSCGLIIYYRNLITEGSMLEYYVCQGANFMFVLLGIYFDIKLNLRIRKVIKNKENLIK